MRSAVCSRGHQISARIEGDGFPLMLLAGGTMCADQWFDAGYQHRLDGFRLIAIDRLGHGQSSRPLDPAVYDERLIVEDLCTVLQIADLCESNGGLRTFLASAGVSTDEDLDAGLARNPVPAAVAAALRGAADYWPDHHAITAPTLWYLGQGEGGFLDRERQLAETLGVELRVTPSDNHAAAFTDVDDACNIVVPMLQRTCGGNP